MKARVSAWVRCSTLPPVEGQPLLVLREAAAGHVNLGRVRVKVRVGVSVSVGVRVRVGVSVGSGLGLGLGLG